MMLGSCFSSAAELGGDPELRPAEVVDHTEEGTLLVEEFLSLCDTGDLVLTAGSTLGSTLIKFFSASRWSHVAVVDRTGPDPRFVCLFESVIRSDKQIDCKHGTREKKGVRLVEAGERIASSPVSDGWPDAFAVALMKLHVPDAKARKEIALKLQELQDLTHPIGYEASKLALARTKFSAVLGSNAFDPSQLFCSELVAEAYKAMNVIAPTYNSSMARPDTFFREYGSIPWRRDLGRHLLPQLHIYKLRKPPGLARVYHQ